MRNGAIVTLLAVAILAGAGVGYLVGNANEHTITSVLTTTPTGSMTYQVVNPGVTVQGQAANTPCDALHFPCTLRIGNMSAILIRYGGAYYWLSYYGTFNNLQSTETLSGGVLTNTWYTIWYDNSTVYCVSPKVQWWNACPA